MKKIGQMLLAGVFSLFDGFCLGGIIGSAFIPKNAGMVGGAMVFWYSLFGGLLCLTLSIFLMRNIPQNSLWKVVLATGGLAVIFLIWVFIRANTLNGAA